MHLMRRFDNCESSLFLSPYMVYYIIYFLALEHTEAVFKVFLQILN